MICLAKEKDTIASGLHARIEAVLKDREDAAVGANKALHSMQDNMRRSSALQSAQAERIKQVGISFVFETPCIDQVSIYRPF